MVELEEIEPGRWRVRKERPAAARSNLPLPYVISDSMDPTEQVDGQFYTSKRKFREVGRALGLIEVGNEKTKPKQRASATATEKQKRRDALKLAIAKTKAGYRP